MHKMSRMKMIGLVAALSLLFAGAAASAEMGMMGIGIRGGLTVDPDQFFVGGHLDLGEFVDNLHFIPNATAGFGDDILVLSANPDILYSFPVEGVGALYVGGILALQYIKYDNAPAGFDDSTTELGIHVVGGLMLESAPIMLELNLGIDDVPDLKAGVGYTFRSD